MSQPYLGQIMMAGLNFAPKGFNLCAGQLLPISQYSALFSLLGTSFGGDGKVTFGLPDLRGRVSNHYGSSPGLSTYVMGEVLGTETVTLNQSQLPAHTHGVNASTLGGQTDPTSSYPGVDTSGTGAQFYNSTLTGVMSPNTIPPAAAQPHQNMQPYLVINFCIAMVGIYPSRG